MGKSTLILGGIKSGKSVFAENLVKEKSGFTVYLATGQPGDDEMKHRIRAHQQRRPDSWETLEESIDMVTNLRTSLSRNNGPVLVLLDSLDGWASNYLIEYEHEDYKNLDTLALDHLSGFLNLINESDVDAFIVSSEVGSGLVSTNSLGRRFQDLLGVLNQTAAFESEIVYLVTAGIPVKLKG